MASLADLSKQVEMNTSVVASAMTLIQGLSAAVQAAANDPAKLQALVDELNASDQALADAVAKNTPAAPEVAAEATPSDEPPPEGV